MKLIIQIPCYNEAETLPAVIAALPVAIDGLSEIETLVIDDGSTDGTAEHARMLGIDHVIRNTRNKGLARSFQRGIEESLKRGADVIVNIDGDNQYDAGDIGKLVRPILAGEADIVLGDRGGMKNVHFSVIKRSLQVLGSSLISRATRLDIADAVTGFRAISREAAVQLNIVSEFSYTIEMLMQASAKRLAVVSVPIRTNPKTRSSRLFKSLPNFVRLSATTLVRMYTMYRPLRVFVALGTIALIVGIAPILRFLYFYMRGEGDGHIQSIVLGGTLVVLGAITLLIGIVADLINFNRRLIEQVLLKLDRVGDSPPRAGKEPSTLHRRPEPEERSMTSRK